MFQKLENLFMLHNFLVCVTNQVNYEGAGGNLKIIFEDLNSGIFSDHIF